MRRRVRRAASAVLGALVVLLTAACSAPPPATAERVAPEVFWRALDHTGLEVDPADSFEELLERSSIVVRASVERVDYGRSEHSGYADLRLADVEPLAGTFYVPLDVRVSDGTPDEPHRYVPDGEAIWFLFGDGDGHLLTATVAGVIGPKSDGELVALRDPAQTGNVLPGDVRTLEQLAERVTASTGR